MTPGWYLKRLRRMSAAEVGGRLLVAVRQSHWASEGRRPSGLETLIAGSGRTAAVGLPAAWRQGSDGSPATAGTIAAADRLLAGEWPLFHMHRDGVPPEPDWFTDPLTGRQAPRDGYAFQIPYRDESKTGNIKFIWEPSRHQATTLLAAAWWLTGREAYAERAARHLTSWWRDNPFLSGIHWTSGIEVGLRLLSWTWMRALLADWHGCAELFDDNPAFVRQLYWHQRYLRVFHSRGSSANNHVVAELAGLSSAAVAFPWFAESNAWAEWSRDRLVQQAVSQTHDDGFNREQAMDYHLFVSEMLLAALLAARLAGQPLAGALEKVTRGMADALAASLDATGNPPRYGDGDDGRGLLLDQPETPPAGIILGAVQALHGRAAWWPTPADSVLARVAREIAGDEPAERQGRQPVLFPDCGLAILRTGRGGDEIWLRCDSGPLGYLSIAAHGHADALGIELRLGGVEILSDPGTYCYHGEPEWRRYFKGTKGHNTLTIDGEDQAVAAGPFLWLTRPVTTLASCEAGENSTVQSWLASHDGYRRLTDPVTHHRRVTLDASARQVTVADWLKCQSTHQVALCFHFGPDINAVIEGGMIQLDWVAEGSTRRAEAELSGALRWSLHRGESDPPLGWYSRGFGHRTPAWSLVGQGTLAGDVEVLTRFSLPPELSLRASSIEASRTQSSDLFSKA